MKGVKALDKLIPQTQYKLKLLDKERIHLFFKSYFELTMTELAQFPSFIVPFLCKLFSSHFA
jgi:hypothetical protein